MHASITYCTKDTFSIFALRPLKNIKSIVIVLARQRARPGETISKVFYNVCISLSVYRSSDSSSVARLAMFCNTQAVSLSLVESKKGANAVYTFPIESQNGAKAVQSLW